MAGTYGRGVWEIDLPLDPASAEAPDPVRRTLMLDPPYPQPASKQTVFRFAARTDQPVSLNIVDAQGRQVSSVFRTRAFHKPHPSAAPWLTILAAGPRIYCNQ